MVQYVLCLRKLITNLFLSGLLLYSLNIKNDFSNGRSRAGVYIAANVAIEQVVQHGEVDVFQAVKNVRGHRPHLIENMVKYCKYLISYN